MRMLAIMAAGVAAALTTPTPAAAPAPAPVEVMVVGVYHMANPGADSHNVAVSDVTTPAKQAQIADAVAALARFRPTAIALESEDAGPDLIDRGYARFTPDLLTRDRNERVQLGYRLARVAATPRVYAIDVQPAPGEPDFFPFDTVEAWARKHDRSAELDALGAGIQRAVDRFGKAQDTAPVAALLADINAPASPLGEGQQRDFYVPLLAFGAGAEQPGADLNARWFTRNARIVAKLVQVARPGDRIVILYGSGHLYWLRNLIGALPGYRLADPLPYLAKAHGAR